MTILLAVFTEMRNREAQTTMKLNPGSALSWPWN